MVESEIEKNRRFTKQVAEIAKNPKPPFYLDDATTQAARELADKLAYVNTHSHLVEIITAVLKRCRNEALGEAAEVCHGIGLSLCSADNSNPHNLKRLAEVARKCELDVRTLAQGG